MAGKRNFERARKPKLERSDHGALSFPEVEKPAPSLPAGRVAQIEANVRRRLEKR